MVGKEVCSIRVPVVLANGEGQIPLLLADLRHWRQVVRRGEAKVAVRGNHRMVAWVIVGVRNKRVERHAAKQLLEVFIGSKAATANFVRQVEIGPLRRCK
jgi:hypothetical protein